MTKLSLRYALVALFMMILFSSGKAQQWGDYTLYSVQNSTNAYLIDTSSNVFHTWTFNSNSKTGYSSYLMPGGKLVRSVSHNGNTFNGGGITGQVQEYDYAGNLIWDYVYSTSTYCMHHDICPLPNGNVLLISYESKSLADATAAGASTPMIMWSEKIVEVQPTGATTGTIVWEWHLWDHLVQDVDAAKANYQSSILDHPELMNINFQTTKDWFHMNGIDYNPVLDQIVFSSHNMNQWFVIDHSTTSAEAATHVGGIAGHGGDFLYRYGNPSSYDASGNTVLNVTHDAHWIPEGVPHAGNIVGFNNRGISVNQSSVDEIIPPLNVYNYNRTAGQAYAPLIYDYRLACNGASSNMGNSQQLPNGNQLVCIATAGTIYEVDSNGTTLWTKTMTGSVPQAFRYEACYVNNPAPAIPTISNSNDTLYSTTATTYQWYFNGVPINGANDQSYVPNQAGVYLVKVGDAASCVNSYSVGYRFTPSTVGISNANPIKNLTIYPNPTTGIINLEAAVLNVESFEVNVFDQFGKLIFKTKNNPYLDLSSFEKGVYLLNIMTTQGSTTKKITLLR